jgi:hypothetical protein
VGWESTFGATVGWLFEFECVDNCADQEFGTVMSALKSNNPTWGGNQHLVIGRLFGFECVDDSRYFKRADAHDVFIPLPHLQVDIH